MGTEERAIKIGSRRVGHRKPCFIIAEAGVNHNGDIALAKRLIDAAREAGADAVKFQTFQVTEVVTASAVKARYQRDASGEATQLEMLRKLELSADDFRKLHAYARQKGIIFLSSPFDFGSIDLLAELGVPAYKVASGEIDNFPLLKRVAAKRKPIILSTGMSALEEIRESVDFLAREGVTELALLHCVSSYPASVGDMNLRVMDTLRHYFNLPVGLSDHTLGICVPIAAAALGACIIEKHFTLDKSLPGPDHKASLEPAELKAMVQAVRDTEKALGDGTKRLTAEEREIQKVARRSLVAKVNIPAGTVIDKEMLAIKRPGTGLAPKLLDSLVGKRAKNTIREGKVLSRDDVEL